MNLDKTSSLGLSQCQNFNSTHVEDNNMHRLSLDMHIHHQITSPYQPQTLNWPSLPPAIIKMVTIIKNFTRSAGAGLLCSLEHSPHLTTAENSFCHHHHDGCHHQGHHHDGCHLQGHHHHDGCQPEESFSLSGLFAAKKKHVMCRSHLCSGVKPVTINIFMITSTNTTNNTTTTTTIINVAILIGL